MVKLISTQNRPIIVITSRGDAHIKYVQAHLNHPLVIIDASIKQQKTIDYILKDSQGIQFVYNGKAIQNPRSIWFRKPTPPDYEILPVAENYYKFSRSALDMHQTSLFSLFPNALWVSNFYAIQRCERKPSQLDVATKLGFHVPDTIFTNNPKTAKAFLKKHKKCVVKRQASYAPETKDGKVLLFFARLIEEGEKIDFSGLYLAPAIFQQAIDVASEIRVTVVGTKVFAATIATKGIDKTSPIIDYKVVYELPTNAKIFIEPYKLPQDIAEKCVAHAKAFNLQFSAIDLLLDKKGKIWFIENNPNGQWAFVERKAKLPIGKAIAELLSK